MKRFTVVPILATSLLLLSGCTLRGNDDIISLYNQSKEITCTINMMDDYGEFKTTLYVKGDSIRENLAGDENVGQTTILLKGDKMYMRGEAYGEGVGLSMSYNTDIEVELNDLSKAATKISCKKGVKSDSYFDIPNNIEFSSMDDWMDFNYEEDEEDYGEYDE